MKNIRIGAGSGFSEDWVTPAEKLAISGNLDYLVFEALAERTIHEGTIKKMEDKTQGYGCRFQERMEKCLQPAVINGVKIITNDGSANPKQAALWLKTYSEKIGLNIKIAYIEGDNVLESIVNNHTYKNILQECYEKLNNDNLITLPKSAQYLLSQNIISANAYIGCNKILEALHFGADIIITGRVADPSLFVAPILYEFNWDLKDLNRVAFATVVGHLLECAGHLTGGYFADFENKNSPNLWDIGFPIAEVEKNCTAIFTKLPNTGGTINKQTVIEQLHYEVHDLSAYITPDIIADFSNAEISELDKNKVKISNITGNEKPKNLKVLLGIKCGYIASSSIIYRGNNALQRARMAEKIVRARMKTQNINIDAMHSYYNDIPYNNQELLDSHSVYIDLRISCVFYSFNHAKYFLNEFKALYTNGPYGGGGILGDITPYTPLIPIFIDRNKIHTHVKILEN